MLFKGFFFILAYNILFSTNVQGQAMKFGSCLVPQVKQDFDFEQFFTGHWYKIKGFGTIWFDLIGICPTVEYKVTSDGEILSLDYAYNAPLQTYLTKYGNAQIPYVDKQIGYFEFNFDLIQGLLREQYPMYILDTDYENYAIVYYCRSVLPFFKIEAGWITSRSRNGTTINEDLIADVVNQNGLKYNNFKTEVNVGCGIIEPHL